MKHYLLSIIASITALIGFAQPQFKSENCFQLNDSSKLGFAIVNQAFENFIPTTGSNYTWDFTTTGTPGPWTSWTSPTASYKFRPSTESIHNLFYHTQINEYSNLSFGRNLFFTYSSGKDTLYYDGLYTSTNYL